MLGKACQNGVQVHGIARAVEQVEGVGHMQAVLARGVGCHGGKRVAASDLADAGGAGVFLQQGTNLFQIVEILWLIRIVFQQLIAAGMPTATVVVRGRRIVRQRLVMEIEVGGVEAEPVDAQLQPEAQIVELCLTHLRMMKVQVRLAGEKVVQIILAAP